MYLTLSCKYTTGMPHLNVGPATIFFLFLRYFTLHLITEEGPAFETSCSVMMDEVQNKKKAN
jgi:hypothetical protein